MRVWIQAAAVLAGCVLAPVFAQERVEVEIEGVGDELLANVRSALTLEQRRREADLSERRLRLLHERAPEEIKRALEPFGYYRARIATTLERGEGFWRARYVIDPGPEMNVARTDLRITGPGAGAPELARLRQTFPLRSGAVLRHALYEGSKREWLRVAAELGYLDAHFARHELRVNLETYEASVTLHFETGPRYRFGPVTLRQNPEVLDPGFLARYVAIRAGDPYAPSALLALQADLSGSDFFDSVEVHPRREAAQDHAIPVDVTVVPRKPNRYTLGVGYGTDTGPRGRIGWERRHITDTGHHLATDLRVSSVLSSLGLSYRIPIRDPRTDVLTLSANAVTEDTDTYDTDRLQLAVSHSRARGQWRETLSLSWQHERSEIAGESTRSTLTLPGVDWSRVWADDRIYTRRGANLSVALRGSADWLASDTTFAQTLIRGKLIRPLGPAARVLFRGDVGASVVAEFSELPASVRFFAGGDQSVRGYEYKSLGPTNEQGEVIGGKNLLVGSVELEYDLAAKWAAAAFYDVGNALDDFSDPLERGAGVGLRWRSPVGQIRVDVAQAVSQPDRPWRLHLSIGPDL